MISSGNLKYKLSFIQKTKLKTEFGDFTETKKVLFNCRGQKLRLSNKFTETKEVLLTDTYIFKIRSTKLFDENLIVLFDNKEYKIIGFDNNLNDRSIDITIEKINK